MNNEITRQALQMGLLKFPSLGQSFPGRRGTEKRFLVDTRGAVAIPPLRKLIVSGLQTCGQRLGSFDVVAGVAKSGTPWGGWLAWEEDLPFANVLLDGPRPSGLRREIEGDVSGRRVVLVDNWARTGSSLVQAIGKVEEAGGLVLGVLVIVKHPGAQLGAPLVAMWDLRELFHAAKELQIIDEQTFSDLERREFS